MEIFKKKWVKRLIVLGVLLVALGTRLYLIGREAVWLDEAFSLKYAGENNLFQVIKSVIENNDSHPPLYYIALHLWQLIFLAGLPLNHMMVILSSFHITLPFEGVNSEE